MICALISIIDLKQVSKYYAKFYLFYHEILYNINNNRSLYNNILYKKL